MRLCFVLGVVFNRLRVVVGESAGCRFARGRGFCWAGCALRFVS